MDSIEGKRAKAHTGASERLKWPTKKVITMMKVKGMLGLVTVLFAISGCGPDTYEKIKRAGQRKDAKSLIRILEETKPDDWEEPCPDDWQTACEALGRLRDPRSVNCLSWVIAMSEHSKSAETATRLLGEMKDPRAIEPLIFALSARKIERPAFWEINVLQSMSIPVRTYQDELALRDLNFVTSVPWSRVQVMYDMDYNYNVREVLVGSGSLEIHDKDRVDTLQQFFSRNPGSYRVIFHEIVYSYHIREVAASSLHKITGEDFGQEQSKWQEWWSKNNQRYQFDAAHVPEQVVGTPKFNEALEMNPRDANAYCERGWHLGERGQHAWAIADFTKALEIDPTYVDAYRCRGNVYWSLGQYDQGLSDWSLRQYDHALSDYNKALEINPRDDSVYFQKADLCKHLGRIEEAIEAYQKVIQYASTQEVGGKFRSAMARFSLKKLSEKDGKKKTQRD